MYELDDKVGKEVKMLRKTETNNRVWVFTVLRWEGQWPSFCTYSFSRCKTENNKNQH